MASKPDDSDYLSPAKRIKLDNNSFLDSENVSNSSLETANQENNSISIPKELTTPIILTMPEDLADLPCSPVPTPPTEEQLEDLVEPLDLPEHDTSTSRDNDDEDDVSSTVSNLSDISGFSDISGLDWKSGNFSGSLLWIRKQMANGINPRDVLSHILGADARIPDHIDDQTAWRLVLNMICEPRRRQRLRHIGTFNDVIHLLKTCSKIIVLTGAGVSVSCGIPDFRSRDGIYSRLAVDFPNLPDPQAMFDINYFKQDPRPFFKFAREIYPGQFKPSPCHRFIKMLERHGKLLRNYSQNIDTLEQVAGIENVIECHGSFATASCTRCGHRVSAEAIKADVFQQRIPLCPSPACLSSPTSSDISVPAGESSSLPPTPSRGVMKPDIVFFGEGLPDSFHSAMTLDKNRCDLLIVIGSSLKVRPVALIPNSLPPSVPQILINRERLSHLNFDVELLGDGDVIIDTLCRALGESWTEVCCRDTPLVETRALNPLPVPTMSPVPLFRNVLTGGDCSEGEMSIDSTRDSGLGGSVVGGVDRHDRHPSIDSRMEEDDNEDDLRTSGPCEGVPVPPTSGCEERPAESASVAECCSALHTTSTPSTSNTRSESAGNPASSNIPLPSTSNCSAPPTCTVHNTPSASSSSHNHHHHAHSVERISFDSGCETTMPSPCHESRLDCENSVNNIVVEEGRCNRHMSIDSTRDSGIGEGSNSSNERHMSVDSNSPTVHRMSLATRLPENRYYMVSRGCYIFPGAEVYSSPDEDSLGSDSEDEEPLPPPLV
ncbi:hypothetical protein M8J77_002422 [Diaphorina citri]|nr:hypothetical protein M8J77_002422 [Diaphorina citri]